jgi:hypothetical protein
MELNSNQMYQLIGNFPKFDHSYETVSQSGYSPDYNLALAVPLGKKNFAWFTFYRDTDVCYLFDLNKEKKIVKASRILKEQDNPLGKGTVVYGTTVLDETTAQTYFVIEDIYFYKGIPLKNIAFFDKLAYIKEFLDTIKKCEINIIFTLPVMWTILYNEEEALSSVIPSTLIDTIGYQTHHIQYRTMNIIKPHVNVILNKQLNATTNRVQLAPSVPRKIYSSEHTIDTFKPQYRQKTVFQLSADLQYDVYHLHAFGKNNQKIYYNMAYIPNYKSSVFMNGLFRKIRENENLDYIEESDDEDDFQNIAEDKYVNMTKTLAMECVFHTKFKRWVPVRIADRYSKIIHISRLVKDYY